ncbi:integrase, catalytic region, zinc finger, CCHC-type containing protein [Tanacetum coccineum]
MSPKNKEHYRLEKEAIHLLLTGIGDEIYLTDDACKTAHDMWIAIGRLQQGESLNIQDVKTNLVWEFGKLTSHDGESIESYYSRFYKMMNEMIRNNLTLATIQGNVQFLQQLQPEGSRFVTIIKQNHDLDTVSYHKLFDVLKQYQKEVNEICAERIAKNANPLALVLAKPITPPSESAYDEDNDPEQAQRDKDMQKYLALIAKYFKKIYKPTNNNLKTSSNSRNKNVDTSLRYKNDNQTGHFGNQRIVTVVGARESVGSQVVQQTGIRCFSCKEFGHFAKDCKKPKRVKDYSCHKEKMLLCKQAKKVLGTDTEPLEQVQYDAEYNVFANERQHSKQPESISKTCIVEKVDSNVIPDSLDMCDNDIQTNQNAEDERATLANLIVNLTLDTEEHKNILKKLKKANVSLTQELKECKSNLEESNTTRDSFLIALQSKQTEHEMYKTLNDCTFDYDKLKRKLNETLGLLAQKEIDIKERLKLKAYEIFVVKEKHDEELVDQAWEKHSHDHFRAPTAHDMEILIKTCLMPLALKTQNDSFKFVHELKQEMHADLKYVESLEKEIDELKSDKADFSNMYDLLLQECVSQDVMCSYLHSLSDLDAHTELQCLYLHKVKECECLAQKLSKQTETVSKEVYNELSRSFAKLEKHSISLELALQQCQEQ